MGLFDLFGGDSSTSNSTTTNNSNSGNTSLSKVVNLSNVGNPQVVLNAGQDPVAATTLGVELIVGAGLILGGLYLLQKG